MTAAPITAATSEAPDRIAADIRCLHCGYNLRGALSAGDCPECGMPVRISLRGDRLADAPGSWLSTLNAGTLLFLAGAWLALPLLYIGVAVAAIGLWLVTVPQPDRPEPSKDERQRWAARLLLFAASPLLLCLTGFVAWMLLFHRHELLQLRSTHLDAAFIAGHAMIWLGLFFFSGYVDGLAARIPSADLAAASRRFRAAWLVGVAATCLIALAASLANRIWIITGLHSVWIAPAFALLVAAILLYLWLETLRFARRLHRALPRA